MMKLSALLVFCTCKPP